jgi:hypothetical protein
MKRPLDTGGSGVVVALGLILIVLINLSWIIEAFMTAIRDR